MFIKQKTFFRRLNKNHSTSLPPKRIKPSQVLTDQNQLRQLRGNYKLTDFLMINGLNKRKSQSLEKQSSKHIPNQPKEGKRLSPKKARPSVCKQLKLPLKNNKLIININSNNREQDKISGNQRTETADSNNRLSPFQTKNQKDFSNFQIFQSPHLKEIPKLKNMHSLSDKENVSVDSRDPSKEHRVTKKKYTLKGKRQRLVIKRKEVDFCYFTGQSENISHMMEQQQSQLEQLQKKQMFLEINLRSFQKVYRQIEIEHKIKTEELGEYEKRLNNILSSLQSKSKELAQIESEIEKNKDIMNTVEQRGKEIMNFVNNQQKRKILHEVSQDYKRKEDDMYDYALQMQTNTWATGLKELKPFTEQEKYLEQRMNSLYRELSNDRDEVSFERKCREIREFVLKMYSSFKRMNDDMRSINDFKTKCIREFVARMQQWLQNWELKQQFLVNLRQEFAVDELKLNESLQSFQNTMILSGMSHLQLQKLKQIKFGIQKITENYKLGNSFY